MIGLLALCAFVIDTGVMWVSKGQAQNAADAGALAGAISLAFDNPTDQPGARTKAIGVARQNLVWAQQPDIGNADVTFPACPPGGLPDTCVRVNTLGTSAREGIRCRSSSPESSASPTRACARPPPRKSSPAIRRTRLKPGHHRSVGRVRRRWRARLSKSGLLIFSRPRPSIAIRLARANLHRRRMTCTCGRLRQIPWAPDSDCRWTPAGSSRSRWTRTRTPQCRPDGSAQFVSRGWMARAGATSTGRTSGQCGGSSGELCRSGNRLPPTIGNGDRAYWAERGCFETEPGNMVGPTRQGVDYLMTTPPRRVTRAPPGREASEAGSSAVLSVPQPLVLEWCRSG